MILPDHIIRSSRKTLSLTIKKDGTIVVNAPNKMKDDIIKKFVEQKQDWLTSKLAFIRGNQDKYSEIINYKKYLLFGKPYNLALADVKKVEVLNNSILIPQKIDKEKISTAVVNFYKKKAKDILNKRLLYMQGILKIKSKGFKISNSKGRWGSCSSNGIITLNWRAVMVNPACIDYIIVHELCHLVEMNHSKRFWTLVETFLPNYNEQRQTLKEYGFLLEMYRN